MAREDMLKTIIIRANTSAAVSKINELQSKVNNLVATGKKNSDEYRITANALKALSGWHNDILKIIKKENDELKKQEQITRNTQDQIRKGFDIIGGGVSFIKNPISMGLKAASSWGNERFDKEIAADRESLSSVQDELRDVNAGLKYATGDEKTTLEKQKAALESQASSLKGSISKTVAHQAAFNTVIKAASYLGKAFGKLSSGVEEAVKEMLDFKSGVATYNTQTSLITNASAREQQLRYGLSSSQNWAFTQAKNMLNIKSDEDLMYMNSEQRERLLSYMERYSNWYNQLESSGVLQNIQEMQLEFAELKQELAMEFLQWVAENKDTIITCIRGIFEVIKVVANVIMGIMNVITLGRSGSKMDLYSAANASDTYNSNTNNKNTNITINANTTNNATGILSSQEAFDQYNEQNWSNLAKQIVGSIGG